MTMSGGRSIRKALPMLQRGMRPSTVRSPARGVKGADANILHTVDDLNYGYASAPTRGAAQDAAAQQAYEHLKQEKSTRNDL
jgi:hypothetical protein